MVDLEKVSLSFHKFQPKFRVMSCHSTKASNFAPVTLQIQLAVTIKYMFKGERVEQWIALLSHSKKVPG